MEYFVTVEDADEEIIGVNRIPVGEWREIGNWLNDNELIDPGNTITIEVKA